MIVKNEEKVIRRCLESVKPHITDWVIHDTGSNDKTKEIILDYLKDIPGELKESEWVDFGHNRNLALNDAKNTGADFILFIDADMILTRTSNKNLSEILDKKIACYSILQKLQNLEYYNIRIINNDNKYEWKYIGVTHEYVDDVKRNRDERKNIDTNDFFILDVGDGGSKTNKFVRDEQLLTEGLKNEPNNARYYFYLAQTKKDLYKFYEAYQLYMKRFEMGGWDEECWYSYYMAGRTMIWCKKFSDEEIKKHLLQSWALRPWRNEPLVILGYHFKDIDPLFSESILKCAIAIDKPQNDILFINSDFYHKYPKLYLAECFFTNKKLEKSMELFASIYEETNDKNIKNICLKNLITINKNMGKWSQEEMYNELLNVKNEK